MPSDGMLKRRLKTILEPLHNDRMKKILIFSLVYYPRFIGGAEVAIKEITDRISSDEYEFHMVTLRLDKRLPKVEKIGNVTVHRVGFVGECKDTADSLRFPLHLNKYILPFIGAWKAHQLHRTEHFHGTWAMMANYSGFAALFFKLCNPKVPYLLSLQEGDPIEYIKRRVGILYPIFVRVFTKADSIQAISHYLGNFARDMGYQGRLEIIPNAVDTKKFTQVVDHDELQKLKETLGKKPEDIFLITTSRLVVKNAVDDVITALTYLPNNIKFLILGVGYAEKSLKDLTRKLGVEDRVLFLGQIDHADMLKYLKVSDVFVRASISEGFGNSFVEAMAAEIPVIATPVGGIVDFLFDPNHNPGVPSTGLFCEVKNPESIAHAVRTLFENPALRTQIIHNGKTMVLKHYDWDLIARNMKEKVFDVLVK